MPEHVLGENSIKQSLKPRRVLRVFVRDGLAVLLLLAALELFLRRVAPEFSRQQEDHDLTGSVPVAVNAEGFRGPIVPKAKKPGELRILALGDSTTFGLGVPWQETWPAQLQKRLEQERGQPVSVINAGVPAVALDDLIYAYEHVYADYQPDWVVFVASGNIIANQWGHRIDKPHMPNNRYMEPLHLSRRQKIQQEFTRLTHRLCLPAFFTIGSQYVLYRVGLLNNDMDPAEPLGPMMAHGYLQANIDPSIALRAWESFGASMARLRDLVRNHGARLVVSYLPPRFAMSNADADNPKNVPFDRLTIDPLQKFASIAAAEGILNVDALKPLLTVRRAGSGPHSPALYTLFDYLHLDPEGHAIFAGAVASQLRQQSLPVSREDSRFQ